MAFVPYLFRKDGEICKQQTRIGNASGLFLFLFVAKRVMNCEFLGKCLYFKEKCIKIVKKGEEGILSPKSCILKLFFHKTEFRRGIYAEFF